MDNGSTALVLLMPAKEVSFVKSCFVEESIVCFVEIVVVLEFGLEAYVGKASFSVEPVVGENVLVFKEFVEAVEEEYDSFVWESCVKDSVLVLVE